MSLLMRKRTVLAKVETTYGTDPVPTGLANAILIKNLTVNPIQANMLPRDLIRPYLGNFQNIVSAAYSKITFDVELAGSGTAGTAPAYGALLRACAMSETVSAGISVTYAPISAAFESNTLYFNIDGVLHKMLGARGSFSLKLSAQAIPTISFTFTGLYGAATDTAAPTVTLTMWQVPMAVNNINTTGLTLQGYSGIVLSDLSIDMANAVTFRSLVGGAETVVLTDRKPVGSITFEATTIAAKDWWTSAKTAALGALAITHGTVAGNKVSINAPSVQIDTPGYTDKDGIAMLQAKLVVVPYSGNDELTIVCT